MDLIVLYFLLHFWPVSQNFGQKSWLTRTKIYFNILTFFLWYLYFYYLVWYCCFILFVLFQTDPNTAFLRAARAAQLDKIQEYLDSGTIRDINTSNAVSLKLFCYRIINLVSSAWNIFSYLLSYFIFPFPLPISSFFLFF